MTTAPRFSSGDSARVWYRNYERGEKRKKILLRIGVFLAFFLLWQQLGKSFNPEPYGNTPAREEDEDG